MKSAKLFALMLLFLVCSHAAVYAWRDDDFQRRWEEMKRESERSHEESKRNSQKRHEEWNRSTKKVTGAFFTLFGLGVAASIVILIVIICVPILICVGIGVAVFCVIKQQNKQKAMIAAQMNQSYGYPAQGYYH